MRRDRSDRDEPLPPSVHVPALAEALGPETTGTVLDGLTAKQRRFVEEYPKDLNGRQAAIRSGYSVNSASSIAYEMLRMTKIVDALAAVMVTRSKQTGLDRSWVLAQLADAHNKVKDLGSAAGVLARLKCLELIGRHVDVRAFRIGLGFSPGDDVNDEREIWDLSRLTDKEFDEFERLLSKVSILKADARGEGGAQPEEGPGAAGEAPRGDTVDV